MLLHSFCVDSSTPQISTILVRHFTKEKRQSPQFSAKLPQQLCRTVQTPGSRNSLNWPWGFNPQGGICVHVGTVGSRNQARSCPAPLICTWRIFTTMYYNILVYTTVYYYTLLYTTTYYYILLHTTIYYYILLYTTTYYYILLSTTVYYNILLYTTIYYYILPRTLNPTPCMGARDRNTSSGHGRKFIHMQQLCVYIYIYIHMYTCVYVYIYIYIYIYIYT